MIKNGVCIIAYVNILHYIRFNQAGYPTIWLKASLLNKNYK